MPRLPPRRVGLGAPTRASFGQIAAMCPSEILALIQSGGGVPVASKDGVSLSAAAQTLSATTIADAEAASTAVGVQFARTAGSVVGDLAGLTSAVGSAAGSIVALGDQLGTTIGGFIGLHGPNVECRKPVNWPARWYYSQAPPSDTSAASQKAAESLFPIAPHSLAAMLIPPLCQAFATFENCAPSPIAAASNLFIASSVNLWNWGAIGPSVDYFVPFVPSTVYAYYGWQGWGTSGSAGGQQVWGGGGDIYSGDTGLFGGQATVLSYEWPPPFVIPGQAKYAFQPLSAVPQSVANPATEYVPGTDLKAFNATGKFAFASPPGYAWSRIRANSGPFVTTGGKVLLGAAATAALTFTIAGAVAIAKGKTVFEVLTMAARGVEKVLR